MNALTYVGGISTSTANIDTNKSVTFKVTEEAISIYGESATVGAITDIERGDFTYEPSNEEGQDLFQVKTKEFTSFLNTFTQDRTRPTDVVFQIDNNRLHLTVHEEPLDGQPSYLENESKWTFDLTAVKKATVESMQIDVGTEIVNSELLQLYVDAMYPLISGGSINMSDSKLNFAEEYVYVFTSRVVAMFKNKLPNCMRGIVLSKAGVEVLKNLSEGFEQLMVTKNEEASKLFVSAGNNRVAIKFNRKMPPYQQTLDSLSPDNYTVIDRKLLKSIIKRLKLTKDTTMLSVNTGEEVMNVGNSRFAQNIPLIEFGGDILDTFKVGVVTEALEDAILGSDEIYPDEVHISPTKQGNAFMIKFSDDSQNWLSIFRVTAR